jgi:hemerythrin-like domain-containing protein
MNTESNVASPPAPNSRQQQVAQQARVEHDALLDAMHHLEAALESAAPGRERAWKERVIENLCAVVDRLTEHIHSADAPDGLMAMIDETRPTLVHRVERLRREHADLLQQARALQGQIEQYGEQELPNFRDIRQRATWLLNALRHHRAAETDLIFESFFVDIGVVD